MKQVAALFVDPLGPYPSMPGVEWWDQRRDATRYSGPHPVVAHPPCARWCKLAKQIAGRPGGAQVGQDGGTFASALASVRRWGGVLEHPAWSLAWSVHDLQEPLGKGWTRHLTRDEWVCEVAQSAYGNECQKLTWLLLVGGEPPKGTLWERPKGSKVICSHTKGSNERRNGERSRGLANIHTPVPFAEFLVGMARSTRPV